MTFTSRLAKRFPTDARLGHQLRRSYRRLRPTSTIDWQHEVLHGFSRSFSDVSFVQVGSNDAGYADPLRFYSVHKQWHGLLIEALPHIYKRLINRYRGFPHLQFANLAISRDTGEKTFYHLRQSDEPGLPPWYDMLGSFSKAHVLGHKKYLADIPERIVSTQVQCATLNQVCAQHGVEQFDVLHIDAEGFDYEILSTIDIGKYDLKLALFENRHLSHEEYDAALAQLHDAGFLTHSDPFDTFGVKREAIETGPKLKQVWQRMRRFHGTDLFAAHSGERVVEATR